MTKGSFVESSIRRQHFFVFCAFLGVAAVQLSWPWFLTSQSELAQSISRSYLYRDPHTGKGSLLHGLDFTLPAILLGGIIGWVGWQWSSKKLFCCAFLAGIQIGSLLTQYPRILLGSTFGSFSILPIFIAGWAVVAGSSLRWSFHQNRVLKWGNPLEKGKPENAPLGDIRKLRVAAVDDYIKFLRTQKLDAGFPPELVEIHYLMAALEEFMCLESWDLWNALTNDSWNPKSRQVQHAITRLLAPEHRITLRQWYLRADSADNNRVQQRILLSSQRYRRVLSQMAGENL